MLSNSFGLEPYNPYVTLGMWEDAFDAVILSERGGVRKPSSVIDQRALDALGLTGPECVFVDDHAQNLPPAEALGIHSAKPLHLCGSIPDRTRSHTMRLPSPGSLTFA
ncbi:HAD-IA family hydrolase [Streptomyces sp. NPDC057301]|uniref:HAD-IA family hydrolase n=1 Tax=Streptomyces sp. NPDC057301 TaxID=3346093 RepID=UPI0036255D8F